MLNTTLVIYISCIILGLIFAFLSIRKSKKHLNQSPQSVIVPPIKLDKLIIGLGNPGKFYENMRHNVGKQFISYVAKKNNVELKKISDGELAIVNENTDKSKIGLFNTYCYMNISGRSIKSVIDKYQIQDLQNIIVVHDDLDNTFGKVKVKEGGSAEGHNGIKSIISYVETKDFKRLKIGIDRPISRDQSVISPYVLGDFSQDQKQRLYSQIFDNGIAILQNKGYLQ